MPSVDWELSCGKTTKGMPLTPPLRGSPDNFLKNEDDISQRKSLIPWDPRKVCLWSLIASSSLNTTILWQSRSATKRTQIMHNGVSLSLQRSTSVNIRRSRSRTTLADKAPFSSLQPKLDTPRRAPASGKEPFVCNAVGVMMIMKPWTKRTF